MDEYYSYGRGVNMSDGTKMVLAKAEKIAQKYLDILSPYCEPGRCVVAGSVCRKKPEIGDLEVVCIPKVVNVINDFEEMFGSLTREEVHPEFVKIVNSLQKVKGEPTGKYTQRILPEGINLDLFIANKDNWGYILAIRIGPDGYSKYLASTWVKQGFRGIDGNLTQNGEIIPVREERDLFRILGLEYVDPEYRMNIQGIGQ